MMTKMRKQEVKSAATNGLNGFCVVNRKVSQSDIPSPLQSIFSWFNIFLSALSLNS